MCMFQIAFWQVANCADKCIFIFSRIGVPAIQERDEESIATERDHQYRYCQGSFRQKLSETTHYGISG